MAQKESGNHPVIKGTLWGAVVGAAGSGALISYFDELAYFVPDFSAKKFDSASIKAIVATTIVGAVIGGFVSAKNHKAWSDRVDESATDSL